MQDASVLGQVFSADALAAVSGGELERVGEQLRGLVRREVLDVERDPKSPERGQYKFVQALIREVAYGTLARRDRRARHLAVARHYEAVGDEEMAGALASHYLAAHGASDEGAEADTIAAQARLALAAAADRAAALGAHEQAVTYLEEALAVTSDAKDRAGLLDRAARSASTAATVDAVRYAQEAISAYTELGDRQASLEATVRLGRVLLDASDIERAAEVLRAAIPAAEELGEPAVIAALHANISRALMRLGQPEASIQAAERALAIAEVHDLEAVFAEALGNKAASFSQLGRRREAVALHTAVVRLATSLTDRSFELRARNNLASAIGDEDPAQGNRLLEESAAVARDIGDRGIYAWQMGTAAVGALLEGREWDRFHRLLEELLEETTLPADRIRLLAFLNLFETHLGDSDRVAEIERLVGDDPGQERLLSLHLSRAHRALAAGDHAAAFREARLAWTTRTQASEIPAGIMLRAAARAGEPELIREAAEHILELPLAGPLAQPYRVFAQAAISILDGRVADAVPDLHAAVAQQTALAQHMEAADFAIDALGLAPNEPSLRELGESVRPLLEELRAAPSLADLDRFLAAGANPAWRRAPQFGAGRRDHRGLSAGGADAHPRISRTVRPRETPTVHGGSARTRA